MSHLKCYCGNSAPYSDCCELLHANVQNASSAEALMRSRYSAFVTKNIGYLISTLHPDFRSNQDRESLTKTIEQTRWLGLKILHSSTHQVEFCAFFHAKPISQLHELSEFKKENDQWFYTQGQILAEIKTGRNDTCVCGSGKKFKKCCMVA